MGEPVPCYYSRAYPEMVITRLISWEDNLKHLILSLIIPNVIFAISIGVLSYWYCPCCDKACRKSTRVYTEKYPNKEEWVSFIHLKKLFHISCTLFAVCVLLCMCIVRCVFCMNIFHLWTFVLNFVAFENCMRSQVYLTFWANP